MTFSIQGFDSSYKVPKFAASLVFGAGAISSASQPLVCLLIGPKTSAGSMTADTDVVQAFDEDGADAYAGVGSHLARMAYKAFKNPNVTVMLAAPVEAGGSTAATVTVLIGGAWTTGGTWNIRVAGELLSGTIGSGDTILTVIQNIRDQINAKTKWPVTASAAVATLTLTTKNTGPTALDWIFNWDISGMPTGMTATVTGSATVGGNAYRVRFGAAGGTGPSSLTNILTKLVTKRYARTACALNDSVAAGLLLTQLNTKAAATTLLLDQAVFGANNGYAAAQTLAQANLNGVRTSVLWHRNSESHPCEIAASMAGFRATVEQDTPVYNFDGAVLPGIVGQFADADAPLDSEQNTALNNGVTPITTVGTSAVIVRAITSHSQNASLADYRTIDIGDAVVPDRLALDLASFWYTSFKIANPLVGDDPAANTQSPPSGVAYPKLWTSEVNRIMGNYFASGWIEDPSANPPTSYYDQTSRRIMSVVPALVRRLQHQLGVKVNQIGNS